MEITSTGIDFLNSFPRIIDSTLSSENNYIQLIFNEDIYNPLNGPVNRESFSDPIIIQGAGGNIVYIDPENDLVVVTRWSGERSEVVNRVIAAIKT